MPAQTTDTVSTSKPPLRVAIADDHRLMLDGIKRALETAPDIRVVGEAMSGEEMLALVHEGLSNLDIAGRLYVNEQTVKFHLSNIYRKLGVGNRTEATRYAYRNRLIE